MDNALARVVISYRPNHGVAAALHNATAYGFVEETGSLEAGVATKALVQHRISVADLATRKPADIRQAVADDRLAEDLAQIVERHGSDKKALLGALDQFSAIAGVRRVRWQENQTVIPIADSRTRQIYKGFKGDGNHCYEIYAGKGGKWTGDVISKFVANGPRFRQFSESSTYRTTALSGHPLIMRLIQGDCVRVCIAERNLIYRVQRFTAGVIVLAYHLGAGDQERNPLPISGIESVKRVAPSALQSLHARRIFVDILGRVFDPGFSHVASNAGNRGGRPVPID